AAKKLTFCEAAKRYAAQHEAKWTNAEYWAQFMSSLHLYAFPAIGDLDVAMVDKAAVLRVLEPIWATKTVTASRVRRRIEAAVVHDHRPPGDNPARWRGHLDQALPGRQQITPVAHGAALSRAARLHGGIARQREQRRAGSRIHDLDSGAHQRGPGCPLVR